MITLKSPITLNPPSVTLGDGTTINPNPITISELDYSVNYNNTRKSARANLINLPISITLWKGKNYDAAGQFTDTDVQDRITTILGDNPQETLQALLPKQA
jgi:hypothetical protein